jgi:hypothetical protein
MSDELFEAYKIKASELLQAKAPFGEHQRRAFEIIVGVEIERLKGEITELTKHDGNRIARSPWHVTSTDGALAGPAVILHGLTKLRRHLPCKLT